MGRFSLRLAIAFGVLMASAVASLAQHEPAWLQPHIGTRDGQIAPLVLERARDHYQRQVSRGRVRNPCYMAMDATRPSATANGTPARRYYVICESQQTFWAVSSGYGNGRNLPEANFSNGRQCARHFSNAIDSNLTTGGAYLTAEARISHKGYYNQSGQAVPFNRAFLVFDGMGETETARDRAIGGHMARFLRAQCRLSAPSSPHADSDGYVRFGQLVDYTSGRSNGCTTWSEDVSQRIISLVDRHRTTLYIYPESRDIEAVADAANRGLPLAQAGLYWDATCLDQIGTPRFWPRETLEPIIARWRSTRPPTPSGELPICQ